MKLCSVTKIWDKSEHNAFTDLTLYHGKLYCVFREASAHVSPDGALRILCSEDGGMQWHSVALIQLDFADLRDGKLLAAPDALYLFSGAAIHPESGSGMRSYCWQSLDGVDWSAPTMVAKEKEWLWRVTYHEGKFYGICYYPHEHDGYVALYTSQGDTEFRPLVPRLSQAGYVNESGLVFDDQNRAICLLRRDPLWQTDERALLGVAYPPYTQWLWQVTNCRIGGPVSFIYQGEHYAVVRLYDGRIRTSVVSINLQDGQITEKLVLPSGGDTSYAGIVIVEEQLWLSYYSSHEGKCAIYFAKILLD